MVGHKNTLICILAMEDQSGCGKKSLQGRWGSYNVDRLFDLPAKFIPPLP